MTDFKLTYEKDNINGDGSLFSYTLKLETEDGKISFLVTDDIEYSISEDDKFNITKGGHGYGEDVDEEKNINSFLEKLKKECFPIEYKYSHEYPNPYCSIRESMENCELNIIIDEESTRINNAKVPTSNSLIESIINFYMNIIEHRCDFEKNIMESYGYLIEQDKNSSSK
jgi:hypothetical protein